MFDELTESLRQIGSDSSPCLKPGAFSVLRVTFQISGLSTQQAIMQQGDALDFVPELRFRPVPGAQADHPRATTRREHTR